MRSLAILAALGATLSLALIAPDALSDSHPAGVAYPLKSAQFQPSGLAHPLPSTRRYVLVWKDQLSDVTSTISDAQKTFIVTHYVGTQKIFKHQIDEYRAQNPNFLELVYHLSYGLNGADQTSPVGNITGPDTFGQEDTDTFTPYVAAHTLTRENAYQHGTSTGFTNNRIYYPDPFWLMDITSPEWTSYAADTLVQWNESYATTQCDGVFFDVAFHPWYNYQPAAWWSTLAGGSDHTSLANWWNPRAQAYFDGLRTAFAPTASHARYLVIPNPDALVDEEPTFLAGTDGVFTENWQTAMGDPGSWSTSVGRISKYVTSVQKAWLADVTVAGSTLTAAQRGMLIGTYLLVRNGTSYIMFGNSDITWYPEYEIDLGGFVADPPGDVEQLKVAGAGGSNGGLYRRDYVAGVVLVNSSTAALQTTLSQGYEQAVWSGGGDVDAQGNLPTYSITYTTAVPAGSITVPAQSVLILQDPAALPPPGVEPQDATSGDGGGIGGSSGGSSGATGGVDNASDGGASSGGGSHGGCGCIVAESSRSEGDRFALFAVFLGFAIAVGRSRARCHGRP